MRPRWSLWLLLLLVLPAFLLSGCWDKRELEETSFVLMLGVDKGKVRKFAITALVALPAKMAGSGEGGGGGGGGSDKDDKPYLVTTVESPTLSGAMSLLDAYLDRRVSAIHATTLFMGDELAKEGVLQAMDDLVRFRQTRRSTTFVVTKGRAADFLREMKPQTAKNPVRFVEQMTYAFRSTGTTPAESLAFVFIRKAHTGYAQPLAYYAAIAGHESTSEDGDSTAGGSLGAPKAGEMQRKGGPNVEFLGGAAFRRDRMVGVLSGDEVRSVLMLQDKFVQGQINLADPRQADAYVAVMVRRGRPARVHVDLQGPRPHLQVSLTLEAEIVSIQSGIDYTNPEDQVALERTIETEIANGIRALIRKTQEWNADVAGLGNRVIRQFPTVSSWEAYHWPDRYQDAQVDVAAHVRLRRFGLQLSPPRSTD